MKSGSDGRFQLLAKETPGADVSLYLVAKGGQAVTRAVATIRPSRCWRCSAATPPANVVVNEITTVASVWTHAQFLDGAAIKGRRSRLRIAAGNVPNFVDLTTGGYGSDHPGLR